MISPSRAHDNHAGIRPAPRSFNRERVLFIGLRATNEPKLTIGKPRFICCTSLNRDESGYRRGLKTQVARGGKVMEIEAGRP